ncbi:MAG: hypothetical protein ACF8PN_09495 [Phycisphaerales bacterium]
MAEGTSTKAVGGQGGGSPDLKWKIHGNDDYNAVDIAHKANRVGFEIQLSLQR